MLKKISYHSNWAYVNKFGDMKSENVLTLNSSQVIPSFKHLGTRKTMGYLIGKYVNPV